MAPLPSWPPALSDAQQADLAHQAATYAFANGFTLLPIPAKGERVPEVPTQVIAAPLSLLPTPFPRPAYVQAKSIQRLYNVLYARVALDWDFLDRIMKQVAPVDDFQAELWNRWKAIREEITATQVSGGLGSTVEWDTGPRSTIEVVWVSTMCPSAHEACVKASARLTSSARHVSVASQ